MTVLGRSDHVVLRRLNRGDLDAFFAYRSDPVVAQFQSWAPMTIDQAHGFLIQMEQEPLFSPGQWCQIAIADRHDALLGDMGLHLSDDKTHVELGITLARAHWGKGIAKAAMHLCFDLVWAETQAQAIRAWGDQRNHRSVALMQSLGMTHLGTETSDIVEEAFILPRPRAN